MNKIIPISKARVHLGEVVQGVREKGDVITLEKGGIPVASIVSVDLLEDLYDALAIAEARFATKNEPLIEWDSIRCMYA